MTVALALHRTRARGGLRELGVKGGDYSPSCKGTIGYGACPKNETCAFSEGLTHTSLHGGRRRGVRENSRLASMERASADACLADNSLIPACGPCSVDLSDCPDLGANLFQVLGVTGLQLQSSCANWSFDEGCPKSCFPHRGLHRGLFHVLIGKVVPFSSCTNCQQVPALVSVHLIGPRDRHLSKLQ